MVLVGLRLVACVFILKLHHSGSIGKRVPDWARRIILGRLGKLFCDKSDTETHSPDKYYVDEIRVKSTKESFKVGFVVFTCRVHYTFRLLHKTEFAEPQ